MKYAIGTAAAIGAFLFVWMMTHVGWERPPMEAEQLGYRGTGMEQITNPRTVAANASKHEAPELAIPLDTSGQKASEIYENVQVLGDLSDAQFTRLMVSITEWVSPVEGCLYCHNTENLASDDVYTKVVARKMIQMTQHINGEWGDHVGKTGVTCLTCHRGQPVPAEIWFENPDASRASYAGALNGQNMVGDQVGLTSLPKDPFSSMLKGDGNIRIASQTALPTAANTATIQDTEATYGLMMHMSQGLGVNCTHCHNSRAFSDWEQSRPQRATAWHGIQMVQGLNGAYLEPLTGTFPENRLGPKGDVAKVNCATCHQGAAKPLNGASMIGDFPSLAGK